MSLVRVMKILLLTSLVAYIAICAGMYFGQRRLLYFPEAKRTPPADEGVPTLSELEIATPDGEKLVAWYAAAKPGQPTILYFHGNGGSLAFRAQRFGRYVDRGRGLLAMSYRGFSGSTGTPTEANNVADAELAYKVLIDRGVKPEDIIIYGESLGTGVGTQLAAKLPTRALILESPYTAIEDRASELYPWLPVALLIRDSYRSRDFIRLVKAPVLIIHGAKDRVVPIAMGRRMFNIANEPKQMIELPDAGHEDHANFGSFEKINAWIDQLSAK
jgi:uncharacterized protein